MKRTFAMLLALALLALTACCALAENAEEEPGNSIIFKNDYYRLRIPAGWVIDKEDLEVEETYQELGILYSPDDPCLVIETALAYNEDNKDMSMWTFSDEEVKEYADTLVEAYADQNAEYMGILFTGNIPFVMLKCEDDEGPYYYAETVTNGYTLMFFAYNLADDDSIADISEEEYGRFIDILVTLSPVL